MNKILIVLMFILLGSAIIVISNTNKDLETSYIIEYQNNKNLAMPDLTGKTEITNGVYRLYNDYGISIDYNIINGNFIINGIYTNTSNISIFLDSDNNVRTIVTAQLIYLSGDYNLINNYDGWRFANNTNQEGRINWGGIGGYIKTFEKTENTNLLFRVIVGSIFDNFTFKLQLEKGSTATRYVVPRLVPIYKDNLTYKEKQEIGMGAFNGITQILRTIGNVIEPIGDFFNGLFSLFN